MLGHLVVGCLLLGLPGLVLLYYALNQSGMETRDVHLMEGGGVALIICGAVVIVIGMKCGGTRRKWR